MVLDHIKNIGNYKFLGSDISRALEIISSTNFDEKEDITYEIDGFDFRYFISSYETQEVNDTPEAHRKFIDIQYMITGSERMAVGQLDDMTEEVEANPQGDIWFYRGPTDDITVKEGMFAIFFPNDAHAPCIHPQEGANHVRKCVFKVRVKD